jgi:hypothetical protein
MTLIRLVVLYAIAALADRLIKKYYGQKGIRFANLALAIGCGYWALFHTDVLSGAASLWFLYAARPKEVQTDAKTGD